MDQMPPILMTLPVGSLFVKIASSAEPALSSTPRVPLLLDSKGPTEWDSPQAVGLLEYFIARSKSNQR
jgi:hypothetical protein